MLRAVSAAMRAGLRVQEEWRRATQAWEVELRAEVAAMAKAKDWARRWQWRVVRGGPRRVRALKEVELAEELAEVLLRRRYAQDAWSEAQCRRAGEAAAAAVALARTEARAGRAASG